MLFAGREPVAAIARGGLEVADGAGWESIALGGLRMAVDEPLRAGRSRWTASAHGFELRFEALGPPAELDADDAVAEAGGMAGYEQLCARHAARSAPAAARIEVRCLGQRGHGWGEPDWEPHRGRPHGRRVARRRLGVALVARAARRRAPHADEPVWAALLDARRARSASTTRGSRRPTTPTAASAAPASSCGSTTSDGYAASRARARCSAARRSTSAQLRLDCAFFRWRIDGATGVGRYDVLRRAG